MNRTMKGMLTLKKIISLVIALCLFGFLLAGCGNTKSPNPGIDEAAIAESISEYTEKLDESWRKAKEQTSETSGEGATTNETTEEQNNNGEYFDPFEGVSVQFTGVSPNIKATVVVEENSIYDETAYTMTRGKWDEGKKVTKTDDDSLIGLSDGDSVVVDVSEALTNVTTQQTGAVPTSLSKSFTVEGEGRLILQYSDLSAELLNQLAEAGREYIQSNYNNSFEYYGFTATVEYTGDNYFYIDSNSEGNRLYFVYHLSLADYATDRDIMTTVLIRDFYFAPYIGDIIFTNNGEIAANNGSGNNPEYTTNMGEMKFINADDHELKIASYRTETNYRGSIQFGDCFETLDEARNAFTSVLDDFVLAGSSTADH